MLFAHKNGKTIPIGLNFSLSRHKAHKIIEYHHVLLNYNGSNVTLSFTVAEHC
ncbi:hypothetical protein BC792_10328 [Sphingobacterium allocomposti]|uniref:Uncharacterized protein n=1 Tax=Sphingobacterium allocomposti TaxID=415956 RepID=A0A5S5DQI9_9SPHI|nr:hypothetical protein BC792_10328 [Sphingobacterium composti Yoo et al. 2007 non Ten et al. 2007]